MRILLFEDGSWVADELGRMLRASGFTVDVRPCSEHAARAARWAEASLLVVDLSLGAPQGSRLLHVLRDAGAPLLVLASRERIGDRVQALEMGADCLAEPFAMPELAARVRALMRRGPAAGCKVVHGALTFDTAARRAFLAGRPLALLPREWAVLEVLLGHIDSVVSKEMIGELIGEPGKRVSANSIETYVSRLRAKLEPAGIKIRTVHRFGYVLEAVRAAPLHAVPQVR